MRRAGRVWAFALAVILRASLVGLTSVTIVLAAVASAHRGQESGLNIKIGVDEAKKVETAKKIPISEKRGQKPVVVASLSPKDLGGVEVGNEVEGFAEVEVSVTCLEEIPQCIGKRYSFSPHLEYKLVLAASKKDRRGYQVGRAHDLTCSQQLPNRNHHCRLVLHESELIKNAGKLPCEHNCRLNVVVSAFHKKAKSGQIVVVGGDSDGGIAQGKAALSAAVFSKASSAFRDFKVPGKARRIRKTLPVHAHSSGSDEEVIYSTKLEGLRKGESLLIDAEATVSIQGLPYNVLLQPELIVAEKPTSPDFTGVAVQVITNNGKVANQNGANCTQGSSYFSNPCKIRKVGAAHLLYNAVRQPRNDKGGKVPLYVNLVLAASQEYGGGHHDSDEVKILGGSIKIRRYSEEYSR